MAFKETSNLIPDIFYLNSVHEIHPDNFFSLDNDSFSNEYKDDLLSEFLRQHNHPTLKEKVFENALTLLTYDSFQIYQEQYPYTAKKLLPIVMLHQIDRSLGDIWQEMLQKNTHSDSPFKDAFLSQGSVILGLCGISLMPNKNGDPTKPPLDLLPKAFTQWISTIETKNVSNQIPLFLNQFSSRYSTPDTLKLIKKVNQQKLPNWAKDSLNSYKKMLQENPLSSSSTFSVLTLFTTLLNKLGLKK